MPAATSLPRRPTPCASPWPTSGAPTPSPAGSTSISGSATSMTDAHGHHHPAPKSAVEQRVEAHRGPARRAGADHHPTSSTPIVETYEHDLGPINGARVVARAWVDPDYRARLLADGTARRRRARLRRRRGRAPGRAREHRRRPQRRRVHAVLVLPVAGARPATPLVQELRLPARMVREPRAVLAEFGTTVPDDVEVRVWDSSAEVRYMVLPLARRRRRRLTRRSSPPSSPATT